MCEGFHGSFQFGDRLTGEYGFWRNFVASIFVLANCVFYHAATFAPTPEANFVAGFQLGAASQKYKQADTILTFAAHATSKINAACL
ncbi:MAG: hypothetical protein LBU43_01725 [Candidatus Accumulibacter sp.]|nr:hypothetical protein [Accumulibacter sp.]